MLSFPADVHFSWQLQHKCLSNCYFIVFFRLKNHLLNQSQRGRAVAKMLV